MEKWKDVEGYEGLYKISNSGRFKHVGLHAKNTGKLMEPAELLEGRVDLYSKGRIKRYSIFELMKHHFDKDITGKIEIKKNRVIFRNLPTPVSVNEYCNRRYPTEKKKLFLHQCYMWMSGIHENDPKMIGKAINRLCGDDYQLILERRKLCKFPIVYNWKRKVVTKNDKMFIKDSSNFIKSIEDQIVKLIGIDDCYFQDFLFQTQDSDEDYMDITIYRPVLLEREFFLER